MLKPMPVGEPIYTTNTNLNELFGFIEAKVTAPSKDELRVPILVPFGAIILLLLT